MRRMGAAISLIAPMIAPGSVLAHGAGRQRLSGGGSSRKSEEFGVASFHQRRGPINQRQRVQAARSQYNLNAGGHWTGPGRPALLFLVACFLRLGMLYDLL